MPERGKVKKFLPDKNIGWVLRSDGSQLFIPPRETPRDRPRVEGDLIEFEVVPDVKNPGKFQATNVRTIEEVARIAGTSIPPIPQGELGVKWEKFGNTRTITIIESEDGEAQEKLQLPIWIRLTKESQPAMGVAVSLDADGRPVPPDEVYTDTDGRVSFIVYLDTEVNDCHLQARVDNKKYTYFWENPNAAKSKAEETTPEPEAPPASTELPVKKNGPDSHGVYVFTISTKAGDQISVHGKRGFEIEVKSSEDSWGTGPFTATGDQLKLEVRGTVPGTLGEVFFRTGNLQSKPRFIERPKQNSGEHHG